MVLEERACFFTEGHGAGGRIEDLCLKVTCCVFLGLRCPKELPRRDGGMLRSSF